MRTLICCALLVIAGCEATDDASGSADVTPDHCAAAPHDPCPAGVTSCELPEDNGLTNHCSCVVTGSQVWWACSDCPFGEGSDPIACTTPGLGCTISTWEHDCACSCTQDGWWSCEGLTVGSHCAMPPPSDAGVDAM